jgi:amidohydrolase
MQSMSETEAIRTALDGHCAALSDQLIAWRRDFHAHPELSNREFRTAAVVAAHLRALGLEVREGVAHTGVVGVLRGGRPGPVVALRADMDALPVAEEVELPFASKATGDYNGVKVPVMHACGHDAHTAILMCVASALGAMRAELPGTVKFIFQPAEEQAPSGEEGGAAMMIAEGVLEDPAPAAIFGLHVIAGITTGRIGYRAGPTMASSDTLRITVDGCQCHGAMPWMGVDPIVVAAQVVLGLQTIASRQVDVTHEPSLVTVGSIHGGVRDNIIPDRVELLGTIRTFDEGMRSDIARRVVRTADHIAQSAGARARVEVERGYDVTINHPELTAQMVPTLARVAGSEQLFVCPKLTGSEDFSRYQHRIPGLFFFLGITPPGVPAGEVASNHSPRFRIDESGLPLGARALAHLAWDFLAAAAGQPVRSASANQVDSTESGLSDSESMPSSTSH